MESLCLEFNTQLDGLTDGKATKRANVTLRLLNLKKNI